MRRGVRLALGVAAVLAVAGEARAQFGYGYYPGGYQSYGWGGWGGGGTVQGSIARGMGYYAAGAGAYNEETAVANSINTDTVMRWNEYLYQSQLIANRNERLRLARREARDAHSGDAVYKRLRDKPSPDDIASGDALNVALEQITNPKIHSSALRMAGTKIPGKVVRDIPFINASEAITISLDKLTAENGWPTALRDPKFKDERQAYSDAVDQALKEDADGDITPQTLQNVRAALDRLRAKLEASRPADRAQFGEAEGYLKTLYGMTRMLERPDVEKVIAELETVKETTLGSLLGFMHTFNLRFGRATTPAQRAAYEHLYPLVDEFRDRVTKGTDDNADAKADSRQPTDFFGGMHLDHVGGKRKVGGGSDKNPG